MKIPNAENAVVSQAKITGYLLSQSHFLGRNKAMFFRQFGFRTENWTLLAEALHKHALEYEVIDTQDTPFGIRYTVEGQLDTPDGRQPFLRTVWVIEKENDFPRLVTAYPLHRRNG